MEVGSLSCGVWSAFLDMSRYGPGHILRYRALLKLQEIPVYTSLYA